MKKVSRRKFLALSALATSALSLPRPALAQAWPSRPIRWIVPFPAGGSTDVLARVIGQWLSDRLGQPVVIENRPGGGTNIGVQAVVNAAPDGYTLLLALPTSTINPSLYKSMPFDFQRDIMPVAGIAELPLVLIANRDLPAANVAEYVAYAKANPGKVNMASFGVKTISHLSVELFKTSTGVDVVHVPYQGGAPMLVDMLSGRIQAGVDALPNARPHIQRGGVKALAVLPPSRTPLLPDVPSLSETIPGLEVSTWSGIGVPRGTPAEIIARLSREVDAGLADPGVRARFADIGALPLPMTTEQFRTRIANDTQKWAKVVQTAGIKPE